MAFMKSVLMTSSLTLLSRILAFFRDQVLAFYLGTSVLADAFFLAFRIPNILRNMFAEGAFQSAFVPILSRLGFDTTRGKKFINQILVLLFFATLSIVLLFEMFMPFVLSLFAPNFPPTQLAQAVLLGRWIFPYLMIVSLVSFGMSILQVEKRFFLAGISQVLFNFGFMASIFFWIKVAENPALAAAYAVLTAGLIQVIAYFLFVKKSIAFHRPVIRASKSVRIFMRKFGPGLFGSGVYYFNMIVNTLFAAAFTGGLSVLHYAVRLFSLPIGVFGVAFKTVLLPHLSETIKHKPKQAADLFGKSLLMLLWLGIPVTLVFWMKADGIVALIYERGAFNTEATEKVALMLKILAIGIVPGLFSQAILPLFYAKGDTKTPATLSTVLFVLNILALWGFTHFYGLMGLGLAIMLHNILQFVLAGGLWLKKYKLQPVFSVKLSLKVIALNSLIGLGLYYGVSHQGWLMFFQLCGVGLAYLALSFFMNLFKVLKDLK